MNKTMKEIWKDVIGYEGLYQVSNTGMVRSCDAYVQSKYGKRLRRGKNLRPTLNADGYLFLTLSKEGKTSNYRVNRLVAEAFLPNPEGFEVVNHKDKNKTNNLVENLEWCTAEYNTRYSSAKAILQYETDGSFVAEWEAISDASRALGINLSNIAQCCRGFRKTAGGYMWKHKCQQPDFA